MYQLSVGAAFSYVRKCLDEIISISDDSMIGGSDDLNLRKHVERSIVEAAVKVQNNAPSLLLDGVLGKIGEDYLVATQDRVATITMKQDVIRMVSIKSADSNIVVTDLIPEESAEGRKQLNQYIRGVPDDPRVVLCKRWADDHKPILKYYTLNSEGTTSANPFDVVFIPYPTIEEQMINIAPKLEYAILNEVVAIVLDDLNEHEKASVYRAKSKEYMTL